jgi:hypothetical protein
VLIRRRVKQRAASLVMNVVSFVYIHGPTGAATLVAELVAGYQSYRACKLNVDFGELGWIHKTKSKVPRVMASSGDLVFKFPDAAPGWYLLPEKGQSLQPKAKQLRKMISSNVFDGDLEWQFRRVELSRYDAASLLSCLKTGKGALDYAQFEDNDAADI